MIFELLVLGRDATEKSSPSDLEIRALKVLTAVNQEEFLLNTKSSRDTLHFRLANRVKDLCRGGRENFLRSQKNRLFVERFAIVGNKARGNVKHRGAVRALAEEHGAGSVPDGVASRLKGRTNAAIGERRGVRLRLKQLRTRKGVKGNDLQCE